MLKSNLIRSIEFGTPVARRQVLHGYYTYYSRTTATTPTTPTTATTAITPTRATTPTTDTTDTVFIRISAQPRISAHLE